MRTPLVALVFWQGDWLAAQNLWRRWMIAHNLPRPGGQAAARRCCSATAVALTVEDGNANEENQKLFIDRYIAEARADRLLVDGRRLVSLRRRVAQTGTWEPDRSAFPGGLRAISDHARAKGVKTLVWFEPERVASGTWLARTIPSGCWGGTLLNLGNAEARQWLTDHVDRVLREQGIDLYRQDFNMDPLGIWRRNDAPDRQGMTENLHVQGYLAYWDDCAGGIPNLIIDSCASGGRRNDLETMRRAVPAVADRFCASSPSARRPAPTASPCGSRCPEWCRR